MCRYDDIQAMVLGRPRRHDGAAHLVHDRQRHSGDAAARRVRTLDAIVQRARNGGAEIVKHLKTGSAYYAPSPAAVQMVEAIVHDKKRILPCAAWLQGEFGMKDVSCGVPCLLGRNGFERIIRSTLTRRARRPRCKPPPRRCDRSRRIV